MNELYNTNTEIDDYLTRPNDNLRGVGPEGGGGGDLPKGQLVGVDKQGEIEEIGKYIVYGGTMFYNNQDITRWDYDLPNLQQGIGRRFGSSSDNGMFLGCSKLTSFSGDMPALTNGESMFTNCRSLTSFSGDLSALTNGEAMFGGCTKLTSFSGDMPALTDGEDMFGGCSSLTSFSGDLSTLTSGSHMFADCSSLTSFSGDLSALTSGSGMFLNCSRLTSFSGDLSALTNGYGMFAYCKLDLASVQRIASTVPTYTSGSHLITIGVDSTQVPQEQQDAANAILVGKRWTVTWQRN